MRSISGRTGAALACSLLLLQACGGEPADGQDFTNDITTVKSPLDGTVCAAVSNLVHSAASEGGSKKLAAIDTHFCWVTKFSGNFDGQQPDNAFEVGQGLKIVDGFWWLINNAHSGNGVVEARCVPKSCFSGDGVNDVVDFSIHNFSTFATADGECDSQTMHTGWKGDAASILHFWPGPGNTNGSGENVQVIQSFNASAPSGIQAADCYHDGLGRYITGRATSLFAGTPNSGHVALFTGSQFSVSGDATLNLGVRADEAICYFTKVFGKFRGAGESVRVYQVASGAGNIWYAKSAQGGSGAGVRGSGQCFFYNQWDK